MSSPTVPADPRRPVVVVDDLHVKYRVWASGRAVQAGAKTGKLRGVSRGVREVHALRGVSFVAYENESIGVIGTNGSGKSTLMRAITGLTPPAAGAVYAASRPNMLGVGAALIPHLSGERNIRLGGLAMGIGRKDIEAMRDEIVEFAELEEFIDLPMRTYSSGMQARLKFSIATVRHHEILIVDEALAVGDRHFRQRSEERIRSIRDAAGTIFLVSHSMNSILDTCNRAIWLNKGELMMDGGAEEVVGAYESSRNTARPVSAGQRPSPAVAFAPAEVEVVGESADSLRVTWAGRGPGVAYRVRYSPTLTTPVWEWPYIDCDEPEGLLTGLEPATSYHIRVRVVSKQKASLTDYSEVASGSTL